MSYLLWNLEKEDLVDFPCYTSPDVQDDFRKRIREIFKKGRPSDEDMDIVKIFAHLTDNVQDDFRKKIREICEKYKLSDGDKEIVKILAPLTENPNAPDGF